MAHSSTNGMLLPSAQSNYIMNENNYSAQLHCELVKRKVTATIFLQFTLLKTTNLKNMAARGNQVVSVKEEEQGVLQKLSSLLPT